MINPKFTKTQKMLICGTIGDWYLRWKPRIVDYQNKSHRVNEATKDLENDLQKIPIHFTSEQRRWLSIHLESFGRPIINTINYKEGTHWLGREINTLKEKICEWYSDELPYLTEE